MVMTIYFSECTMVSLGQIECPLGQSSHQLITVIFCKSCAEQCTIINMTCLQMGLSLCITTHVHLRNAAKDLLKKYGSEHHWTYSPDMNPSDLDLLPKLKEPIRGQRFSSWEDFSVAVAQCIWQLNKWDDFIWIKDLPKRWNAVI